MIANPDRKNRQDSAHNPLAPLLWKAVQKIQKWIIIIIIITGIILCILTAREPAR